MVINKKIEVYFLVKIDDTGLITPPKASLFTFKNVRYSIATR
jgi:hypothetical protein